MSPMRQLLTLLCVVSASADGLYPVGSPVTSFTTLSELPKKGDEPWVAVLLTWGIAQCCVFIGGLNEIAPIITSFFCLPPFDLGYPESDSGAPPPQVWLPSSLRCG